MPRLRAQSGIPAAQIVGLAIDFTCSTMVPLDKQGQALCLDEVYASRPHAWVKLWKHHGAKPQAEALQRVSEAQDRPYPDWYGGVISQETLTAKVLEVFAQDRAVYDAADAFVDAGDYVTSQLAGEMCFSLPMAAAKAFWCKESGYPDAAFFGAIDPALADMPQQKLMAHFPNAKRGLPRTGRGEAVRGVGGAAWAVPRHRPVSRAAGRVCGAARIRSDGPRRGSDGGGHVYGAADHADGSSAGAGRDGLSAGYVLSGACGAMRAGRAALAIFSNGLWRTTSRRITYRRRRNAA